MMNDDYLKEFKGRMATLKDYNASIVDLVPCLMEEWVKEQYTKELADATEDKIKKAKEYMLKRGSATLLLIGSDQGWYGSLKNQLQQNMTMGTNNYPKSVDEIMNILNTFAKTLKSMGVKEGGIKHDNTKVAFAQKESKKIICYHCSEEDHIAKVYPKKVKGKEEAQVHTQLEVMLNESDGEEEELGYVYHQNSTGLVWKTCLLIDSKSSIDIFNKKDYLKGVHETKKPLKLHCNIRHNYIYKIGWFGHIEVWYHL